MELPAQGALVRNCTMDTECPGRLICVFNVTWVIPPASWGVAPGSNGKPPLLLSACLCPSSYGMQGPNCTEISPGGQFQEAIDVIGVILTLGILLLALYDALRVAIFTKTSLTSPTVQTLFLNVLTFLFTVIMLGIAIGDFSTPSEYVILPGNVPGLKGDPTWFWSALALLGTSFFETNAFLNCSVMWITVHFNVSRMKTGANLNVYRRSLRAFQAIYAILLCVALLRLDLVFGSFLVLVFVILIFMIYTVGASRLISILEQAASGANALNQTGATETRPATNSRDDEAASSSQAQVAAMPRGRDDFSASVYSNVSSKTDAVKTQLSAMKTTLAHTLPNIDAPTRMLRNLMDLPEKAESRSHVHRTREQQRNKYQKVIFRIRRTSLFVAFFSLWIAISSIILLGLGAHLQRLDGEPGGWDRPVQWCSLALIAGAYSASIALYGSYVHPTVNENISQAKSKLAKQAGDKKEPEKRPTLLNATTGSVVIANAAAVEAAVGTPSPLLSGGEVTENGPDAGKALPSGHTTERQRPSLLELKISP